VNTMKNGDAAEVWTIGNEGVVGLPLVLDDDRAPTSVYVQVPGAGLRMKATLFNKELARSASMRTVPKPRGGGRPPWPCSARASERSYFPSGLRAIFPRRPGRHRA